mmetsp:Transcript_13868/g.37714  ORF Transcript_13868/g.37714 Transcript_13868/m.37714 type:complete len:273 (+) Transcript_13868:51-869(+)
MGRHACRVGFLAAATSWLLLVGSPGDEPRAFALRAAPFQRAPAVRQWRYRRRLLGCSPVGGSNGRTALAAADPNFAANVGQAIDTLRADHGRLPGAAPGLAVANADIGLSLAQVPSLRFEGVAQYRKFWDNFRSGVELVSSAARSEVVNVAHSGTYIRIRWRLRLTPRMPPGGKAAASALRTASGALSQGGLGSAIPGAFGGWLKNAGDDLINEMEQWSGPQVTPEERTVDLNSVYELDCWTGRVARHTLEFRTPDEDFGLLGVLQGVPSYR